MRTQTDYARKILNDVPSLREGVNGADRIIRSPLPPGALGVAGFGSAIDRSNASVRFVLRGSHLNGASLTPFLSEVGVVERKSSGKDEPQNDGC